MRTLSTWGWQALNRTHHACPAAILHCWHWRWWERPTSLTHCFDCRYTWLRWMAMAAIILIVLMAIQDFTGKVSPRPYKAGILQQLGGSNVHPPAFLKVAHARMPWRGPSE
jgi:hypothetical protein